MSEEGFVRVFERKSGTGVGDRRIARKRFSLAVRNRVYQRTDGVCYLCKSHLPPSSAWHIEHVLAFSVDPAANDVVGNLLPACAPCNLKKSDKCLLECMGNDHFSLDSQLDYDGMSLQPRVKVFVLRAIAVKHALRAGRDLPDDKALETWCDAADSVASADLPVLDLKQIDFENMTLIGKGAQGKVYSALYGGSGGTAQRVAVKIVTTSPNLEREKDLMKSVMERDPPSIVRYLGYGLLQDFGRPGGPPDDRVCLVMELMDGDVGNADGAGVLFFLGDAKKHTLWIVTALRLIHKLGWMHRDVKPRNILYSEKARIVKLADFGLVTEATDLSLTENVGTADFRAPEIRSPGYTNKVDIYSLGKTLRFIKNASGRRETVVFLDSLAARCTKERPADRPTAEELFQELTGARQTAPPAPAPPTHAPAPPTPSTPSAPPLLAPDDRDFVYVSSDDKRGKYHSDGCWGTLRITLASALRDGRQPCTLCGGGGAGTGSASSAQLAYVTSLTDSRGKYHMTRGCSNATTAIDYAKARKERDACSHCGDSGSGGGSVAPAEKMVYVTSTTDKRGKYHSARGCYGASERITLKQAKKDGREAHC